MNFHEYQAKQLFADYGIAVPAGRVARSPAEAVDAAKAIGGEAWMVGSAGTAYRWNGTGWSSVTTNSTLSVMAMAKARPWLVGAPW